MQEEKKRKKISIDFDYDVEMLLDAHKRGRNGVSYASMINEIVRAMFGLEPQAKAVLNNAIQKAFNEQLKTRTDPGSFSELERQKLLTRYDNIYRFINDGLSLASPVINTINMVTITLKDSRAIVPDNWIRIDWDPASQSNYVGVIETRNGAKFGGVPHFYFTSRKEIHLLSDIEEDAILNRCIQEYPLFREILDSRVTPIKVENKITNLKELDEAPQPGLFSLPYDGSPTAFTFGAKLIKNVLNK